MDDEFELDVEDSCPQRAPPSFGSQRLPPVAAGTSIAPALHVVPQPAPPPQQHVAQRSQQQQQQQSAQAAIACAQSQPLETSAGPGSSNAARTGANTDSDGRQCSEMSVDGIGQLDVDGSLALVQLPQHPPERHRQMLTPHQRFDTQHIGAHASTPVASQQPASTLSMQGSLWSSKLSHHQLWQQQQHLQQAVPQNATAAAASQGRAVRRDGEPPAKLAKTQAPPALQTLRSGLQPGQAPVIRQMESLPAPPGSQQHAPLEQMRQGLHHSSQHTEYAHPAASQQQSQPLRRARPSEDMQLARLPEDALRPSQTPADTTAISQLELPGRVSQCDSGCLLGLFPPSFPLARGGQPPFDA